MKCPLSFYTDGGKKTHLQIMKVKNTKSKRERKLKENERAVIHRNLLPVCLTAFSQVINTLKAFL